MPLQPPQRLSTVLAGALAATGLVLAVAGCGGHITPLGPEPGPTAVGGTAVALPPVPVQPSQLLSPLVLEAVRIEPAAPAGGCPDGSVALSGGPGQCYRELGTPVTIVSASVSSVVANGLGFPARQYGFVIVLPVADQPAMKAITTTAAAAHGFLDITVAGRTWLLPRVLQPFTGPLVIAFPSKTQVLQLHSLLVPFS